MKTPLGDATEVSTRVFIDELLPPLHAEFELDALFKDPASCSKKALPVTKNNRLYGYSMKTPSVLKTRKAAAFKGLQICTGKLIRAMDLTHPCVHLRNNESSEWSLKKRSENALPDAYFLFQDQAYGRVDWTNIAIPGVYHKLKTNTTSKENVIKIARCLSQCMNRDARRRFMYGFAVEDSTMRLFYCNRGQLICSSSFDFVTEWGTLFEFWLRIFFATTQELGLDPSIELLPGGRQYDIKVRRDSGEEQTYRTIELLADPSLKSIIGRGTRVWKVRKVENGAEIGEPAVLKDCWVSARRIREGIINANIMESAVNDEQRNELRRILLTVLTHGDVFVGQAPDCTKRLVNHPRRGAGQDGDPPASSSQEDQGFHPQTHYRIVYKEVCQPLDTVTSLFTVFKSLGDACNCLRILHVCGWVHRDVSVGNILIFDDFVKLGDLEYAERIDRILDHKDGFIGTQFFMPVEVKLGGYLWLPTQRKKLMYPPGYDSGRFLGENSERLKRGDPLLKMVPDPSHTDPEDTRPFPKFRYNPIHDLESLWWIAAYFLIHQIITTKTEDAEEFARRSHAQRQLARDFFWTGTRRLDVLKAIDCFAEEVQCLHHSIHDVASLVNDALTSLVNGYVLKEESLRDDILKLDDRVHHNFIEHFYGAAEQFEKHDIPVHSLEYQLVSS